MSLNAFHCSFRSSTTKLSLPASPLQVTPKNCPTSPTRLPPSGLPPYPSDLHLQPLLAFTLNLNINQLMVTHLWLFEKLVPECCVCCCSNAAGGGHCWRGKGCPGSWCHHHLESFILPFIGSEGPRLHHQETHCLLWYTLRMVVCFVIDSPYPIKEILSLLFSSEFTVPVK